MQKFIIIFVQCVVSELICQQKLMNDLFFSIGLISSMINSMINSMIDSMIDSMIVC